MAEYMRCACEEGDECGLFNVFVTKNEEDLDIKYTTYLVGHCGYWLVNALNISGLLIIEGWVFGRLSKSFLSQLSLLACCFQIMSCTTSIMRYNMMDEFAMAFTGTLLSIIAFTLLNISYLYFCSTSRRFVQVGTVICILIAAIVTYLSYTVHLTTFAFKYIRPYIGACQVFNIVGIILGSRNFEAGIINIDVVARDSMSKLFKVCIFLNAFSFVTNFTFMPIVYPLLGVSFTSCVIAMAFVGTSSDYMSNFSGDKSATIGEQQPLTIA